MYSVIRDVLAMMYFSPDYASLHPGYVTNDNKELHVLYASVASALQATYFELSHVLDLECSDG